MKDEAESIAVTRFLQSIVKTHEQLHELARQLRARPEVKTAKVFPFIPSNMTQHHWDEEQRKQAFGSDFGVSAELNDGAVVDWWLEVRSEEGCWHIICNIFRGEVGEEYCHKAVEFEERQSFMLENFTERLAEVVTDLSATANAPQLPG